ncbi:orotate phosphoribosyltransferase-like protein [Xylariaceae sp. FL0804]|nr:orotate phosphoribosyltransferase-like protein [Xylariaceae sp. FL0804]
MALPKYKQDLLQAAIDSGALRFGSFELKSKRISPYFFNTGDFYLGATFEPLIDAYAHTIAAEAPEFDVLFGPAYKGIPLAAAATLGLVRLDRDRYRHAAYSFDRKEVKDHGEGSKIGGAGMQGKRVLIIDDVVSAGEAKKQAIDLIRAVGGDPVGIVVALDRQETLMGGDGKTSAIGQLRKDYGIPVIAILKLEEIIAGMKGIISDDDIRHIEEYRAKYGTSD